MQVLLAHSADVNCPASTRLQECIAGGQYDSMLSDSNILHVAHVLEDQALRIVVSSLEDRRGFNLSFESDCDGNGVSTEEQTIVMREWGVWGVDLLTAMLNANVNLDLPGFSIVTAAVKMPGVEAGMQNACLASSTSHPGLVRGTLWDRLAHGWGSAGVFMALQNVVRREKTRRTALVIARAGQELQLPPVIVQMVAWGSVMVQSPAMPSHVCDPLHWLEEHIERGRSCTPKVFQQQVHRALQHLTHKDLQASDLMHAVLSDLHSQLENSDIILGSSCGSKQNLPHGQQPLSPIVSESDELLEVEAESDEGGGKKILFLQKWTTAKS